MLYHISASLAELGRYRILNMDLAVFIWIFMLYNFFGWFYESTIFSLGEQGKFMNRGYFIGPYCPIYGCGFFFNYYMLIDVVSPFKIFLISMATCTVIEYVTSWVLEKMFNARYWDYSYFPLNINGRVSLISSFFFGLTIMIMMKIATPFFIRLFTPIPNRILDAVAIVLVLIFIADGIVTFICMQNLNRKCRELYDAWDNYVDGKLDILNEKKEVLDRFIIVRKGKRLLVKAKNVNEMFVDLETRYLKNSGFRSTLYGDLIERMRRLVNSRAEKDDSEQEDREE